MSDEPNKAGYVFSGALHAGLLAAVIFGFASTPKFEDTHESIPVETISQAQFSQIMKGVPDAPAPKPVTEAALKPTLAQSAPPPPQPPPRPADPPPPPPEPPKPETPKPEPTAPEPPVRPKPVETPTPKPTPKVDALAKLLAQPAPTPSPTHSFDPNKILHALAADKPTPNPSATVASAAAQGLPQHNAPKMSLSMKVAMDSWFQDAYRGCWSPPPPPPGDKYVAQIRVAFDGRGALTGQPLLANPPSDPAWRAYAESALRAVLKCNPLHIPPQYAPFYEEWRTKLIHFDPDTLQG